MSTPNSHPAASRPRRLHPRAPLATSRSTRPRLTPAPIAASRSLHVRHTRAPIAAASRSLDARHSRPQIAADCWFPSPNPYFPHPPCSPLMPFALTSASLGGV
jgi:hypothetical protein